MIIFRYLAKEVIYTVLATTAILMLIFLSTQFVHYLSGAAIGKYTAKILMHVMLLQIPYLLGLLMPAGLYLALLLAYGRLHVDREMVVMSSCGMSERKLVGMTMVMALAVMVVVAILNIWVTPIVAGAQKRLFAEAKAAPLIETMLPGRFFATKNGKQILYIEQISRDRTQMRNIFVAQSEQNKSGHQSWSVVSAARGYQSKNDKGGRFMTIADGNRYQAVPGQKALESDHFQTYSIRLAPPNPNVRQSEQAMSTLQLWHQGDKNPRAMAELQWRISMPLSVLILALLALPLSQVNPRQGRFAQLIPAVLIYIIYANMMFVGRSWVQLGKVPPYIGLWWLHGCLLLLALTLMAWKGNWWTLIKHKFRNRVASA